MMDFQNGKSIIYKQPHEKDNMFFLKPVVKLNLFPRSRIHLDKLEEILIP